MDRDIEISSSASPNSTPTHEKIFQSLPPLGSTEYLDYIANAPPEALPPEVLARAFRQLPPDSPASRATLRRLFGRCSDGSWEYFSPLLAHARRRAKENYEESLQNAFTRILETLPGPQGAYAERAWNAFCYVALIDAWRERYGRRGERLHVEESLEVPSDDDDIDKLSWLKDPPPWLFP
jgi:hypothetical protein